jgi:hypothetical protein
VGHVRLGRIPKTLRWREVVALLDDPSAATDSIAASVAFAAQRRLQELAHDPGFGYPLWLLTRITWSARSDDFAGDLSRLGINLPANVTPLGAIASLTDHVRSEMNTWPERDHFTELSLQAFRQALTETVAQQGASLFEGSAADVQRAFRDFSTPTRFGELARRFFAAFMSRALLSFVDRELPSHIGVGKRFEDQAASSEFQRELNRHVWQTAYIVEDFAGDWYSKHNWESKGEITPPETQQFLAIALRKLRSELLAEAHA